MSNIASSSSHRPIPILEANPVHEERQHFPADNLVPADDLDNKCDQIAFSVLKGAGYGAGLGITVSLVVGASYGATFFHAPAPIFFTTIHAAGGLLPVAIPTGALVGGLASLIKQGVEICLKKIEKID